MSQSFAFEMKFPARLRTSSTSTDVRSRRVRYFEKASENKSIYNNNVRKHLIDIPNLVVFITLALDCRFKISYDLIIYIKNVSTKINIL